MKQSNHPSSRAPFLILQLDNYVGDNKNLHVFAFGACMIAWGWFDVVLYCYLVEGHTHWLVDSTHSTHNVGLFRRFIASPIDICKGFNELFHQNIDVHQPTAFIGPMPPTSYSPTAHVTRPQVKPPSAHSEKRPLPSPVFLDAVIDWQRYLHPYMVNFGGFIKRRRRSKVLAASGFKKTMDWYV